MIASGLILVAVRAAQPTLHQPDVCTEAVAPPASLSGWTAPDPMMAAATVDEVNDSRLTPGRAVTLTLRPTPSVRYAVRPERPGGSVSHGGLVAFDVVDAGRYRVALGSPAWLDVVRDGAALRSVAHSPGPACSGIRKLVDFDLSVGRHVIQIAGNGAPTVAVMVARVD